MPESDAGRPICCLPVEGIRSTSSIGLSLSEARLAPEPVLCFDGDEAGRRAAWRAAERALPLLEAGRSLFFVTLPKGEDPDSLISAQGAGEMRKLFEAARPLAATIWDMETAGQRLDSPERLAGLEKRLKERAFSIADRNADQFDLWGANRA